MTESDKMGRLYTVASQKSLLEMKMDSLRTDLILSERKLKSEKINYNKKVLQTRIVELRIQIDEHLHQYSLLCIERDLLDEAIGLEII
jgi:hypothetical protein